MVDFLRRYNFTVFQVSRRFCEMTEGPRVLTFSDVEDSRHEIAEYFYLITITWSVQDVPETSTCLISAVKNLNLVKVMKNSHKKHRETSKGIKRPSTNRLNHEIYYRILQPSPLQNGVRKA